MHVVELKRRSGRDNRLALRFCLWRGLCDSHVGEEWGQQRKEEPNTWRKEEERCLKEQHLETETQSAPSKHHLWSKALTCVTCNDWHLPWLIRPHLRRGVWGKSSPQTPSGDVCMSNIHLLGQTLPPLGKPWVPLIYNVFRKVFKNIYTKVSNNLDKKTSMASVFKEKHTVTKHFWAVMIEKPTRRHANTSLLNVYVTYTEVRRGGGETEHRPSSCDCSVKY